MKFDTQKYKRPVTSRFVPTDWEKSLMSVPWVNCDPVARIEIESGSTFCRINTADYADRHGYPTA
jgi:hypothetical protein